MSKKLGILTGGGDCPGLNPAIRACVLRAADHGFSCTGLLEGWRGLIDGKTVPLDLGSVEGLTGRGGTVIGTSRTNPYKNEGGTQKCLENLRRLELSALVAMGGEDTLGVAAKLFSEQRVPVVGVPKTMDNDLSATDYAFGFDTAATIAVEAAERLRDTGRSHRRIMVLEVMGRHAGWVAAYTGIAAEADWTLLPERPVEVAAMLAHLKKVHARSGTALVVTSEAIEVPGGQTGQEKLDEFGHMLLRKRGVGEQVADLIDRETKIETRVAVIGHIQRGGPPTLFDRILATRLGVAAADLAATGKFGQMVALRGNQIVSVPLAEATATLKTVTPEWLSLLDVLQK